MADYPFVPAAHRRPRQVMPPTLIVLHDGETNEGDTAAEGMAAYFASGNTNGSAHICADNNSIVRCALDSERTNGAGGVNEIALHIEQAGRARQTINEWNDDYSRATIANAAQVAREWIKAYHIPDVFLDAGALANGRRFGITTHREVTLAGFAGNDGHSDPGPYYPIASFMSQLRVTSTSLPEDIPMVFHCTIDGTASNTAIGTWYLMMVGMDVERVSNSSVEKSTLPRLAVAESVFRKLEAMCSPAYLGR